MRGKLNYYPRAPELFGRYAVSGVYIRSRRSGKQNSERIYTLTALRGLRYNNSPAYGPDLYSNTLQKTVFVFVLYFHQVFVIVIVIEACI